MHKVRFKGRKESDFDCLSLRIVPNSKQKRRFSLYEHWTMFRFSKTLLYVDATTPVHCILPYIKAHALIK